MRIKLRSILSQMYRLNSTVLCDILKAKVSLANNICMKLIQVTDTSSQFLLDFLHAMTVFCDVDINASPQPASLPTRVKSIRGSSGLMTTAAAQTRYGFSVDLIRFSVLDVDLLLSKWPPIKEPRHIEITSTSNMEGWKELY